MEKISEFINEVQSIDVSIEKYYCSEDAELIKQDELPEDAREYYILIDLYVINKSSESKIRALYNNARLSLARLSKENLKNAGKLLLSYDYIDLYKESQSYLYKLQMRSAQREDEEMLLHSMQTHLMFDVPSNGTIVGSFVIDMFHDVNVKKKYLYALINDILALLEDINKGNKTRKSQNFQINESALIELIKGNLSEDRDITIEFEHLDRQANKKNTSLIFSHQPEKASADLQFVQSSPNSNIASSIDNNIEPTNIDIMDINFERIFATALAYEDDPTEMKEFCIREQKKADRDCFYKIENFYKNLKKVVAEKKELAKYQSAPTPTHIGSFFIAGGGGSGYNCESIELLEQVIDEICNEEKTTQSNQHESTENNEYAHLTALQWGAVIHYIHAKTLRLKRETVDNVIAAFREKHDIKLEESTLRNRYYEATKKITETFNYKSVDLEKTLPFFKKHYNHLTGSIKHEINYLKINEEEYDDNQ